MISLFSISIWLEKDVVLRQKSIVIRRIIWSKHVMTDFPIFCVCIYSSRFERSVIHQRVEPSQYFPVSFLCDKSSFGHPTHLIATVTSSYTCGFDRPSIQNHTDITIDAFVGRLRAFIIAANALIHQPRSSTSPSTRQYTSRSDCTFSRINCVLSPKQMWLKSRVDHTGHQCQTTADPS